MTLKRVIGLLAIVCLAGLILWIANNTYWEEVPIPQPLRGEAADNPFYSAAHLARSLGAQARWQRVLGAMPPRNGVVVASDWHWGLMADRRERLERWVASGGRLVIDRSLVGGQQELETWSGISRYSRSRADISRTDRTRKWEKCPTLDSGDGAHFQVCALDRISALRADRKTSWALRDASSAIQAVRVPIGFGSVTLINTRPFGNREMLDGDHGALFVAATQLRRGDQVWFLTEEAGASLLSLIWTTAAPVVVLAFALIAAWLWRSSVRFGPPAAATDPARRSLAEQIRGTGQFTVRFGGGHALHTAAVRALQETADRYIPGYLRLSPAKRTAKLAELAGTDASALAAVVNYSGPRRLGDLRQGLALLESVRRSISATQNHREGS